MTDQQNTPDQISWAESGIIIKQIVLIIVSIASLAGIVFTPEMTAQITSIVTAVMVIGFAGWTIHQRINKPCPPIQPKGETK